MKTPTHIAATEVFSCASELIGALAASPHVGALTDKARALYSPSPEGREPLEHWIVSDWLARKLANHKEIVDTDFAGVAIWGRTTSGQAIELDDTIVAIAEEAS